MAGYAFETISPEQAASFGADDYLFFIDSNASSNEVQVAPFSNGSLGTGIELTYAGKTVTFPNTISDASMMDHIQFNDSTHLQIGTSQDDDTFTPVGGGTGAMTSTAINTVYALNGDDTINFGGDDANSTPATGNGTGNYLNGGFGSDEIMGGAGNNHIYGNSQFSQAGDTDENGAPDGQDTITVTTGTNAINGNAGDDLITVNGGDTAGDTGNNNIRGGAGDDEITIHGAGANAVNGNIGNDTIDASDATFNNLLRGGQGNDTIMAGQGHDGIFGDIGSDHLVSGTNGTAMGSNGTTTEVGHLTVMTGGADGDVFDFSANDAATGVDGQGQTSSSQGSPVLGTNINGQNYYQTITDFTHGTDQIALGFTIESGDLVHGQQTFSSVSAAANYATGLLQNHTASTGGGEIAAVQVGSDTYLFYHAMGGDSSGTTNQIDSVIHLTGVDQSTLSQGTANSALANGGDDFIMGGNGTTAPGQPV